MNTEISGTESETPEAAEPESIATEAIPVENTVKRGRPVLAFLAFLFSIAALAGTGWMWWQDQVSMGQEEQRMFAEIARLDNMDSELSLKLTEVRDEIKLVGADQGSAELDALQSRLKADRSKVEQVEKALNEQVALSRSLQATADSLHGRLRAAEGALTGMSTRELDAGAELDVAEVDYLLRLANERLKLFSDPAAADQALEVADMHLAALDNPIYVGVRQDIAAARRSLASVNIPDYLDIASRLDSLQQNITSLPFRSGDPADSGSAPVAAEGWWEKVKGVFSNLVTVRRSTDEENERISLQDKDFIRQRAWLQLEVAHLALMRRDQQAFRSALARVQEMLPAWFDGGDSGYQSVMQQIDSLASIEVQVDVPDITAPWSTLRMLRAGQPRPAEAPPIEAETADTESEVEEELE